MASWTRCIRLCALVVASVVALSLLRFCMDIAAYSYATAGSSNGDLLFMMISLVHGLVGCWGIFALVKQNKKFVHAYLAGVGVHILTYVISIVAISLTNRERMVKWLCFSHTYNTSSEVRCMRYLTLPAFNEASAFASSYTKHVMYLVIIACILALLCVWSAVSFLRRKAQYKKMVAEHNKLFEDSAVKGTEKAEDVERGSDSELSDDESPAAAKKPEVDA